ncbi:MAG: hypothetical protein LH603_20850 [Pseudonocardia sp.]|nr:hypothetical protein [Pseudonocardia sp.]
MRRHIVMAGLVLAAAGAVAGCSSEPDLGPVFNNEGGQEVSCMAHQTEEPGLRYTDKATRDAQKDTVTILALMKYYTANGAKSYCDNEPADDVDRAWGQLYVDLGGTTEKASSVLG